MCKERANFSGMKSYFRHLSRMISDRPVENSDKTIHLLYIIFSIISIFSTFNLLGKMYTDCLSLYVHATSRKFVFNNEIFIFSTTD